MPTFAAPRDVVLARAWRWHARTLPAAGPLEHGVGPSTQRRRHHPTLGKKDIQAFPSRCQRPWACVWSRRIAAAPVRM